MRIYVETSGRNPYLPEAKGMWWRNHYIRMIGKGDLSESRMSAEGEKSYRKKKGICALQQKMREQKDGNMRPLVEDGRGRRANVI